MTQDTNPILTEDDIPFYDSLINGKMALTILGNNTEQLKKVRQQILTAIEQYPKLKEEVRQLKFRIADEQDEQNTIKLSVNHEIITLRNENTSLKAENEELKKEQAELLTNYSKDKLQIQDLQQENNQLKQLKQRVEEAITSLNDGYSDCCFELYDIEPDDHDKIRTTYSQKLQQLLKDDT